MDQNMGGGDFVATLGIGCSFLVVCLTLDCVLMVIVDVFPYVDVWHMAYKFTKHRLETAT